MMGAPVGQPGELLIDRKMIRQIVRKAARTIYDQCRNNPAIMSRKEQVYLLIILKGAVPFGMDVVRQLQRMGLRVQYEFLCTSSYNNGTESGEVRILLDALEPISGRTVFVIEDIVDTGKTLDYLLSILLRRMPKHLGVCALLNKPSRRTVDLSRYVIWSGADIEDLFVVGYGLDCGQEYRDLPEIFEYVITKEK